MENSKKLLGQDLQKRIAAARVRMERGTRRSSPAEFKQVAAEVCGPQRPKLLRDSPEADQRIARAKNRFRSKWQLEQLFESRNIIVPTDSPTLRLLYCSGNRYSRVKYP